MVDTEGIKTYIDAYDPAKVKSALLSERVTARELHFPILYFAAERNSPELVSEFLPLRGRFQGHLTPKTYLKTQKSPS